MSTRVVIIHRGRVKGIDMNSWESLVEATINSVCIDSANKEARIEVTRAWENKGRMQIVATGVDDIVLNELRLTNIIDRVRRFSANDINDDSKEVESRLFFLMRGKEPSPADLEWPTFKEKLARIRDGSLGLLEVEPVYGATVLILAEDFRLEPML